MTEFEERITRESAPALRVEHDLRYGVASPLVAEAATWADLGCGSGVAARAALQGQARPACVILADIDTASVQDAARELGLPEAIALTVDLSAGADLSRLRAALLEGDEPRVITCFEVIEHLRNHVPLTELMIELAEAEEATALVSVPNDAFTGVDNPHHHGVWGEGAIRELRAAAPAGHVVLRQVPIAGSAVLAEGEEATLDLQVHVGDDGVPAHYLIAFGPAAKRVSARADAIRTDLSAQRGWERAREANLAFAEAQVARLTADNKEMQAHISRHDGQLEEWRRYIHELEERLGLPLSGT